MPGLKFDRPSSRAQPGHTTAMAILTANRPDRREVHRKLVDAPLVSQEAAKADELAPLLFRRAAPAVALRSACCRVRACID